MAYPSTPGIQRKPVPTQQVWETPKMPEPLHYAPGRQDPVREALEARGHVLASMRVPNIYNSDGNFDGAATNTARTQKMQAMAANMALTNVLGSNDGDHQRVTFRADSILSLPSSMPQVMIRRGVPRAMFDADIARFTALLETRESKERGEFCLGMLTCWISLCIMGSALDVYNKELRSYVMEMNRRYEPYSVTWSMEFIPYGGAFVSYET